jgi:hypothetical protein
MAKLNFKKGAAVLVLVPLIAGCSTPLEKCVASASENYRTLENAISTTQGNITRGYAEHKSTVPYTVQQICYRTDPHTKANVPYSCPQTYYRTQITPVAIDVVQERVKLAEYKKLLPKLSARANAGIKQCEAQFPVKS